MSDRFRDVIKGEKGYVEGWDTKEYRPDLPNDQKNEVDHQLVQRVVQSIVERKIDDIERETKELDRALLDEDTLENIRRKRIDEMRSIQDKHRRWREDGHGKYIEIHGEAEFFSICKQSELVIVVFYTDSNRDCDTVDARMKELANNNLPLKCVKINAEKVPYLSEKLKITMIPSFVLIKKGFTEHTIRGFDELGGTREWTSRDLESVLRRNEFLS